MSDCPRLRTIVFDTETTGLNPGIADGDEILSLSIIDGSGEVLFDQRFKPRWKRRWDAASRVNNIWPLDVASLQTVDASIPKIGDLFSSADRIVAYNASFDLKFIGRLGIDVPRQTEIVDTMLEFAAVRRVPDYRHGWKRFKLVDAARYVGYSWEGAPHGSLADARACLAVQQWLDARRSF